MCLGTAAMWIRSYWRVDGVKFARRVDSDFRQISHELASEPGVVGYGYEWEQLRGIEPPWSITPRLHIYSEPAQTGASLYWIRRNGWEWMGFAFAHGNYTYP